MKLAVKSAMCALLLFAAQAFAQAPFYQGKTITVIATTAPGGTGDMRVKSLTPALRKHIPGNPTLIIEYMDGGGGRKGANYLFRNAKPDGLTIGAMSGGVIALQIMRESGVMYDIDKFSYLGSPESVNHYTIYSRKDLGLNSLDKPRAAAGIRIGAQGTCVLHRRTALCVLLQPKRTQIYRRLHGSRGRRSPAARRTGRARQQRFLGFAAQPRLAR